MWNSITSIFGGATEPDGNDKDDTIHVFSLATGMPLFAISNAVILRGYCTRDRSPLRTIAEDHDAFCHQALLSKSTVAGAYFLNTV
jgi:hypothetical protein